MLVGVCTAAKLSEKWGPPLFSADETADGGLDNKTPVAEGIGMGRDETRFTGTIHEIIVEVEAKAAQTPVADLTSLPVQFIFDDSQCCA